MDSGAESVSTVTGGSKPLHRLLRGQPKAIGVVLVSLSISMWMFGIVMIRYSYFNTSVDVYMSFWLGIMFFACGLLYIQFERSPSKKLATSCLALSIVSVLCVIAACIEHFKVMFWRTYMEVWLNLDRLFSAQGVAEMERHHETVESLERVFLFHSLVGGVLLVTMCFFSRAALQSSHTQAIVVMRSLEPPEGPPAQ